MDTNQIESTLRTILALLQERPERYRCFGVYWWPVKALLKRYYTQDNLYLLGSYEDRDTAARVPRVGLQELIAMALEEYNQNARYNLGRATVVDTDGAPCTIYDEDVGL